MPTMRTVAAPASVMLPVGEQVDVVPRVAERQLQRVAEVQVAGLRHRLADERLRLTGRQPPGRDRRPVHGVEPPVRRAADLQEVVQPGRVAGEGRLGARAEEEDVRRDGLDARQVPDGAVDAGRDQRRVDDQVADPAATQEVRVGVPRPLRRPDGEEGDERRERDDRRQRERRRPAGPHPATDQPAVNGHRMPPLDLRRARSTRPTLLVQWTVACASGQGRWPPARR